MFEKKSRRGVAELFFQNPRETYHLREIARETGISVSSVSSAVDSLEEDGILSSEKKVTRKVRASGNQRFLDMKRVYNLQSLIDSGMVDRIEEELRPDALVLFGSYSRGEDDSDSDIDLALINGKDKKIETREFEEKLGRDVSIVQTDLEDMGENFRSTLANGVVLRGYLDL